MHDAKALLDGGAANMATWPRFSQVLNDRSIDV
jgi:hypothetical protein